LAAGSPGGPAEAARTLATIRAELATAVAHVSPPAVPTLLTGARELSDPGPEPPSYHVFSTALLGITADTEPGAMTPATVKLREQVTAYALQLMAPDGQLSFAGRSLDQSWVQAAGAALGAREAADNPALAPRWRTFAERAFDYLRSTYPPRSDGLVP